MTDCTMGTLQKPAFGDNQTQKGGDTVTKDYWMNHFDSRTIVRLWKDGWLKDAISASGVIRMYAMSRLEFYETLGQPYFDSEVEIAELFGVRQNTVNKALDGFMSRAGGEGQRRRLWTRFDPTVKAAKEERNAMRKAKRASLKAILPADPEVSPKEMSTIAKGDARGIAKSDAPQEVNLREIDDRENGGGELCDKVATNTSSVLTGFQQRAEAAEEEDEPVCLFPKERKPVLIDGTTTEPSTLSGSCPANGLSLGSAGGSTGGAVGGAVGSHLGSSNGSATVTATATATVTATASPVDPMPGLSDRQKAILAVIHQQARKYGFEPFPFNRLDHKATSTLCGLLPEDMQRVQCLALEWSRTKLADVGVGPRSDNLATPLKFLSWVREHPYSVSAARSMDETKLADTIEQERLQQERLVSRLAPSNLGST